MVARHYMDMERMGMDMERALLPPPPFPSAHPSGRDGARALGCSRRLAYASPSGSASSPSTSRYVAVAWLKSRSRSEAATWDARRPKRSWLELGFGLGLRVRVRVRVRG